MMVVMTTSGIYAIYSECNGRIYVGHSHDIPTRLGQHRSKLRNNKHPNQHLQRAWNKYGEDAFEFIILEECLIEILLEREQFHMDLYPDKYNLAPVAGSSLGIKRSDETKQRMSEAQKGKTHTAETRERLRQVNMGNTNAAGHEVTSEQREKISADHTGRKHTAEARANMGASHLGYKHTDEARSNMSEAQKGNTNRLGIPHTEEAKAKMSEAKRAYWARKREEKSNDA